jgi:excisionase family DNA binding protein
MISGMPDDTAPGRPRWSVAQAAKRAGVARSTIQRYIAQGRMPGAYRTGDGVWSIGVEDLLGAGLMPDRPAPPDEAAEGVQHAHAPTPADDTAELARRVAELEAELAAERALLQAERARRESDERKAAEHIADLRRSIAALEAGRSDRNATPPAPATATPAPRQRGLLGRFVDNLGL